MTPLGQKVKELRVAMGLTQQKLAEQAGVSQSLISALESGRRKYVGPQDITGLAASLEVPEDELWALIPGGSNDKRYIPIAGKV